MELARSVYADIFEEIGVDVFQAIRAMSDALDRRSFTQRLGDAARVSKR